MKNTFVPALRGVSVNGQPIDTAQEMLNWARYRMAALESTPRESGDFAEIFAVDSLFYLFDEVMGIA